MQDGRIAVCVFCITSAVFMCGLCFKYVPITAKSDVCTFNLIDYYSDFFFVLSVLCVELSQLSDGV